MKNVKLIFLAVTATLFLGIGNVSAQKSETVIIKVYEFIASSNSKIMVIDPKGVVVETELKKMLTNGEQNIILMQKEIDKWKNEGFTIDGISGGTASTGLVTTIILSKNE